jgi:asparagine synthetase B (glutamine-hydrolysing)
MAAAREMARWAARGRISFWQIFYSSGLLPLIPSPFRDRALVASNGLPSWMSESVSRKYDLAARSSQALSRAGRLGHKYHDAITTTVKGLTVQLESGFLGDALDVRYPFLYRPLVEFALSLPPQLCAQPHARKWVLREAMRGILPEKVRTRVGKGGPTDALLRSLANQRALLEPLVQQPILAELGVVDEGRLQHAFANAPVQKDTDGSLAINVQNTLMVEAWLRMRAGRWKQGVPSSTSERELGNLDYSLR